MKKSRILCLLLSLVLVFATGLTACGGGGGDGGRRDPGDALLIYFYGDGDDNEREVFTKLTNTFNDMPENQDIFVEYVYSSNLGSALKQDLGSDIAPEIFYVGDGNYKEYVEKGYIEDLTDYIDDSDVIEIDEMWPSIKGRYLYNKDTNRSGDDAGAGGRYYALPKDIGPTVLFYNANLMKSKSVTVISVAPEDLAGFNSGAIPDDRGFYKDDYGINGNVKEKGYFEIDGAKFFNNQVAMSWDEVRALAELLQDTANGIYGYHTEWWFSYGWSVGGDCIQYIETAGTPEESAFSKAGGFYDFTLVDGTKNFIVADSFTQGITINGNHYGPGEIISYQDKLTNEYELSGAIQMHVDAEYDQTLITAVNQGKVNELPSQREAFAEFVRLSTVKTASVDGVNGYAVCPTPTALGGNDGAKTEEFTSGRIGMLADGRWNVTNFRKDVSFDWDVAPLPVYKTYDNQGNIKVHGVEAGHSGSKALAINAYSSQAKKDAAWRFIEYLAGPVGQTEQSKTGFAIPSQMEIAMDETSGVFLNQTDKDGNLLKPYNAKVFVRAAMNEHEGDWAYLENGSTWIDPWANALNGEVRDGKMTYSNFLTVKSFTDTFKTVKDLSRN